MQTCLVVFILPSIKHKNLVLMCVLYSEGHAEGIDLMRSWMLPVFRDHVQDTQVAFFVEYFLPLASQLKVKCKTFVINVIIINTLSRV